MFVLPILTLSSMTLRNYFLFFSLLFVLSTCSSPVEKSPLEQMEETYQQSPSPENGQALAAMYEGMLDTLPNVEAQLPIAEKAALLYFRLGSNEGLQANFSRIVNDYGSIQNSSSIAQGITDTLLYSITDPETQRLIPTIARQYIALANVYAKAKPDAPESPEKLYKAAEIARSIGAFQEALNIYATIESYFPQYEKAPKALFMQAFTYAEDLKDEEQARALYERFLEKYPEDDFVDDAQILLDNLGKSDEEIFQQLDSQ